MTGIQLKNEIRKLGITQESAADKLGISLRQLHNWFNIEELDIKISHSVQSCLGINLEKSICSAEPAPSQEDVKMPREVFSLLATQVETLKSQQETIRSQQDLISRLVKTDISQ